MYVYKDKIDIKDLENITRKESMMKTEKEKMMSGELYNALSPELSEERKQARMLFYELNSNHDLKEEARRAILQKLLGNCGLNAWIEPPFYCDYGYTISIGDNVFINYNCTILDPASVTIGNDVLIGPNVNIYTATHSTDWQIRKQGLENAKPVTIGNDVWIGGGVIICPGVSIGDRTTIGAGSVVTKDIPSDVVAVGNPCRVIRNIKE